MIAETLPKSDTSENKAIKSFPIMGMNSHFFTANPFTCPKIMDKCDHKAERARKVTSLPTNKSWKPVIVFVSEYFY